MPANNRQQHLLKQIPGVDSLLEAAHRHPQLQPAPRSVLTRAIRETLDQWRNTILNHPAEVDEKRITVDALMHQVAHRVTQLQAYNLQRVINATGVVVHTNLGRSCLAAEAIAHLTTIAGHYSNLEFDLEKGRRGSRYNAVEALLCELSGAEAALAVNNNAGAVMLCLDTLARGKQVIISRGELVEIGGSFRIPDVMAKSGAILKEVGTTNRTHLRDYENAIGSDTGLLLKVHTSNYAIIGFTTAVPLSDLKALGTKFKLPVMEDLGSGNFIDFARYGLTAEPTVQASVAAGADVVTFSGDKLLGGPQAGLIVGKKAIVDAVKANPLTRALRIDKLTLAALEVTLRLYRDEAKAVSQIPTLRMITIPQAVIQRRAEQLAAMLESIEDTRLAVTPIDLPSKAGGGSLPMLELPSSCVGVSIQGVSPNTVEAVLRRQTPAVIGRIENDLFIMDPRTIEEDEPEMIRQAFMRLLKHINTGVH